MDLNLVVICGRLAATPDVRVFESGTRLLEMLVTIRAEEPRKRVDVVPITMWDPPDDLVADPPEPASRIWVAGSVQRRFWESPGGQRRSRLEIVADQVTVRGLDAEPADGVPSETA